MTPEEITAVNERITAAEDAWEAKAKAMARIKAIKQYAPGILNALLSSPECDYDLIGENVDRSIWYATALADELTELKP